MPTRKLITKPGQACKLILGFCKKIYPEPAKPTGTDIKYEIFKIFSGFIFPNDKPKIVEPDLDKPGITDKP